MLAIRYCARTCCLFALRAQQINTANHSHLARKRRAAVLDDHPLLKAADWRVVLALKTSYCQAVSEGSRTMPGNTHSLCLELTS